MKSRASILVILSLCPAVLAMDAWDRVPPPAESLLNLKMSLDETGESQLRFGGHARTMVESYRNRDFGFAPVQNDDWVHHRLQMFGVWELDRVFKLMAELTWGEMQGMENDPGPPDQDRLDLLQLYTQTHYNLGDTSLKLRAGRQMLFYGSGRLLAHREGANQRLVHDALRLGWERRTWRMDTFIASPVQVEPESFDNASRFHQTQLWGLYATGPSPFGEGHSVDIYYLGLRRDSSPLAGGQQELRHTLGSRWFGKEGPWDYNHEFIFQTGDVADRDILACAMSLGGGYTFDALLSPTLRIRGDLISGGQSASEVNTFDPLFQANNYFNEGGFISPSNLYNINPRLGLQLTRRLSLDLGVNFLWRFDTSDAVYSAPFRPMAGEAPNGERYLGTAYNASLSWDPHPAFNILLGFTHHEAGSSLSSVGGQDVNYLQVAARLEF